MDIEAITAQVQRMIDTNGPRLQGVINEIEDSLDSSVEKAPVSLRLMMYESIFVDALAKFIAAGAVTFNKPIDTIIDGVSANLREATTNKYNEIKRYQNVHANGLGAELPPDEPNR